uniref:Uncharacterized protein n=1 Tax=Panagrellus redivivus TaxID=6233 RepID=A0A7E4V0E7_PANRE
MTARVGRRHSTSKGLLFFTLLKKVRIEVAQEGLHYDKKRATAYSSPAKGERSLPFFASFQAAKLPMTLTPAAGADCPVQSMGDGWHGRLAECPQDMCDFRPIGRTNSRPDKGGERFLEGDVYGMLITLTRGRASDDDPVHRHSSPHMRITLDVPPKGGSQRESGDGDGLDLGSGVVNSDS